MNLGDAFTAAFHRLTLSRSEPELLPSQLAKACTDVLPVAGAGVSLFAGSIRVPLGASDAAAADAEQLQFTTGEGPCIHAHRTAAMVRVHAAEMALRWPMFHAELLAKTRVRSIIAAPLGPPLTGLGTVDLFFSDPDQARHTDLHDVATVVDQMAALLVDGIPLPSLSAPALQPPGWLRLPLQRRSDVAAAVGMLTVALHLTDRQALDVLRGHAFATDRTLDATVSDVLNRQLPVADLAPHVDR